MTAPPPSSGADPAHVAALRRVGETDPDTVRAYIDMLIRRNTTPEMLAMPDAEFWRQFRSVLLGDLASRRT